MIPLQTGKPPLRTVDLAVAGVFSLAAAMFATVGLWAIATLGLTELYADQWRQYAVYLSHPFPENVFIAHNGHRTVFPSLIRLLELRLLSGNQTMQLAVGAVLASTSLVLVARMCLRETAVDVSKRWAIVALTAFTLFWTGNARVLLHGNELVNVYLVLFSLIASLSLAVQSREATGPSPGRTIAMAGFGVVATFSIGSGIAVLPALALVLALQRHYRQATMLACLFAALLSMYIVFPGGDGVRDALTFRPIETGATLATWLSSMWTWLLDPFITLGNSGSLIPVVRTIADFTAPAYVALLGDYRINNLPFTVIGWIGLVGLCLFTWQAWRPRTCNGLFLFGLGMAWCAVGVAGIVSLGRLDYLVEHSGQIFANRYLPWSCLFWCGLLITALSRRADQRNQNRHPAVMLPLVFAVLLLGFTTTRGNVIWARIVQEGLRVDSAGFVSGVVEPGRDFGETIAGEVVDGVGRIRDAGVSAFAWPEARMIGQDVSIEQSPDGSDAGALAIVPIGNRLGGEALRVDFEVELRRDLEMPARLLVVIDGRASGVLVGKPIARGWKFVGYANRAVESGQVVIAQLLDGGRIVCRHNCQS